MTLPDPRDVAEWDKANASYTSPAGSNASERLVSATAAAQQMGVIEARYDEWPGGFRAARERFKAHIKAIVDGSPPLTDEQLCQLARLLRI
jgi:hypothetical protein